MAPRVPASLDVEPDTLGSLLRRTETVLGRGPRSRWVLSAASGVQVSSLLARQGDRAGAEVAPRLEAMLDRVARGEPLQYVLGTWEFRTLELVVDERVLIPRPETEQVVSHALEELSRSRTAGDGRGDACRPRVADLGTGSGAIALSIAVEHETGRSRGTAPEIWATDVSSDALEVAAANLRRLEESDARAASFVRLSEGDWFGALPPSLEGRFDLIVANPPYVSRSEWSRLEPQVRDHEPSLALVGGETGLEALGAIVAGSASWLAPGASLVLELAPHQARHVAHAARAAGFASVEVRRDLTGASRSLVARVTL